eukprot:TRINITY_DN10678_c0_g1_i3.p1 TRINITY_DN10678_c0_g1~~TRINITY_DN10678_c0_g1_i3.p1  ORF type:complete len:550 (+),score=84.56 TRINITY_DN10678_c0_g1_i3:80-1729(+)
MEKDEAWAPLRQSAFSSVTLRTLHSVSWSLIEPEVFCINHILAVTRRTTDEERCGCYGLLLFPLILLAIICFPLCLIGLPLYLISHYGRRPFIYDVTSERHQRPAHKTEWHVVNANVNLLPDGMARQINLRRSSERARMIAVRITSSSTAINRDHTGELPHHHTLLHFPAADFVCFQEVHDQIAYEKLRQHLHKLYPHVVADPGVLHWRRNRFVMGSGLMIASKYPVMMAEFEPFNVQVGRASQGLLMVKVFIAKKRKTREGHRRTVAYIYVTQLKGKSTTEPQLRQQLDELEKMAANFRTSTVQSDEVVAFQVLCGDWGFDNVVGTGRKHPLWTQYHDAFKDPNGQDREWSLGTRLQPQHVPEYMDAKMLRADLLDESRRSSVLAKGKGANAKAPGHARYAGVLLQHSVPPQLPVRPVQANMIMALAGYTCNLPVHLTFQQGEIETNLHRNHSSGDNLTSNGLSNSELDLQRASHQSLTELEAHYGNVDHDLDMLYDQPVHQSHRYRGCIRVGTTNVAVEIEEMDLDSMSDEEDSDTDQDVAIDLTEV